MSKEKEIDRLNNIINRAIEFIEKYCIDDEFYINLSYKEKAIFEVLKILKGIDLTEKDKRQIKGLKEEFKISDKK